MTQPTHDEIKAWIDEKIRVARKVQAEYPEWATDKDRLYLASLLANRAGLERHKERPFNWMTDKAIGMFSKAFPEPPRLPRCVTCQYENFPCPTYTDIYNLIVKVM